MGADYAKAQWLPCKNFWAGGNSMEKVVIHGTASGGPQTGYQLAISDEFNRGYDASYTGNSASVTYLNDVDGIVYQTVQETDSHWGNCCVYGTEAPAGYYPIPGTGNWHLRGLVVTGTPGAVNMNRKTISIENVKHSTDNSESLTAPQYNSLVALVADICTRRKILPVKGAVIGHFDLDPVNKARCPGTFDWSRFYRDLHIAMGYGPLPTDVLASLALAAGFAGDTLAIAVAVSLAESSGMPYRQGIVADGSLDRGVVQFNSHWHPEVTDAMAYDPSTAFKQMYRVTGGTTFTAWTTYTNGSYKQFLPGGSVIPLTSTHEVATYPQSYQLEQGETEDACGFFSNALAKAMGQPPSSAPHLDSEGVDQLADQYYVQYDGPNVGSNTNGMTSPQQEAMLNSLGIAFTHMAVTPTSDHAHDVALITAWLKLGYPVIVTIPETSVYDMEVGGGPYAWVNANPAAWAGVTHIMTATGISTAPATAGHLLYRDTVNYRTSPRTYSNDAMIFNRAIAINPPWLPKIADGYDPLIGGVMGIPPNWKDDGTTLVAPNGQRVVGGFRLRVLNAVPQWTDLPLEGEHHVDTFEYSNPTWNQGGGQQQTFSNHMLAWSPAMGVKDEWMGAELMYFRKQAGDLKAKAADLAAQLAACQAAPPPIPVPPIDPNPQLVADLAAANTKLAADETQLAHVADIVAQAKTLLGELQR